MKSLRTGLRRASALAADAAASAAVILEHSDDAETAARTCAREGGRTQNVPHIHNFHDTVRAPLLSSPASSSNHQGVQAQEQVEEEEDDCVWVERQPIPWQTTGVVDEIRWRSLFDATGALKDFDRMRESVYYGGCTGTVRREAWKWLLGCYPLTSTRKQRQSLLEGKRQEYACYKLQWSSITPQQALHFAKFRDRRQRIDKDVVRTDRDLDMFAHESSVGLERMRSILLTYSFYNFDLSYCQGMSDLLAPLLLVMDDEVEAFWCFQKLMERMEGNFHKDLNGMHTSLLDLQQMCGELEPELLRYLESKDCSNFYFCFRWLLIMYKREFVPDDTARLWEALWASKDKKLHLYLAIALLRQHMTQMMEEDMEFDGVLKLINGLALKINCLDTLKEAHTLSQQHASPLQHVAHQPPSTN